MAEGRTDASGSSQEDPRVRGKQSLNEYSLNSEWIVIVTV